MMRDSDQQDFIPTKPSGRKPAKRTHPRAAWKVTGFDAALLGAGFGILLLFWVLS